MLRVLALSSAIALTFLLGQADAEVCGFNQALTNGCDPMTVDTTSGPTSVTLTGTDTTSGSGAGGDGGDSNDDPFADCDNPNSETCIRPFIGTITNPVTLSDIATFHPTPAVDHSQPTGWTIIGLDTNFYATGGQHIVDGTLLGRPASVRFTPVQWHWYYGDGASASHPVAGSTWRAQGIREFDPTSTSHIYRDRDTFTIDLDVEFAAEYRYAGGPWVPITGTLTIPANRLTISVGHAKTVLVEHDCRRNPAGPGC